jgi:hypothetical protein
LVNNHLYTGFAFLNIQTPSPLSLTQRCMVTAEQGKDCTFSPSMLTKKSPLAPKSEALSRPLSERLNDQIAQKLYFDRMLPVTKEKIELSKCTFTPQTNKASKSVEERRSAGGPIHERLHTESDQLRQSIEAKQLLHEAEKLKGVTFNPQVTAKATALRRKSFSEGDTIFNRLSTTHTTASTASRYTHTSSGETPKVAAFIVR